MLSSIANTKYADHHPPGPTDNTSLMLKMCFLADRGFVTFRGGGGGDLMERVLSILRGCPREV